MNIGNLQNITLVVVLLNLFCTRSTFAQTINPHKCGFDHSLQELKTNYPEEYPEDHEFERWMTEKIQERRQGISRSIDGVVELPVVVHIIHSGEPIGTGANISDAQIYSQINSTNEDFRRTPDSRGYNAHPDGADTEIQFCLAQIDPDGNPTTGINRVNLGVSEWNRDEFNATAKPATQWDPEKYANLWVVESFEPLAGGFILLGYAQFPSASGLPGLSGGAANTDGVVMISSTFGTLDADDGTFNLRNEIYGRTTTHEIGHWLGLRHIWGDGGCSVDDYCDDTPRASAPNYGCSASNSCDDTTYGWPNNPPDMVENYMDYSGDLCMNIFTNEQKERMRTVLENSPRRASLLDLDVCSGAPIVSFSADDRQVCPGTTVRFSDESLSNPTSWNWSFPGGDPSSSTEEHPEIFYANPGNYTVTLQASNEIGTNTDTKNSFVNVSNSSISKMLYRDFAFDNDNWQNTNPDGGIGWEVIDVAGIDGNITKAISVQNKNYTAVGQRDAIESPIFSLYGRSEATMNIKYAYRKRNNIPSDSLIIYLSKDGGTTYPYRLYADADDDSGNFSTNTNTSSNFTPTFALDWCFDGNYGNDCLELDLIEYAGEHNLRVKLENYNNNNNNIYVKDIDVSATCVDPTIAPLADIVADNGTGCNSLTTVFDLENVIGNIDNWFWTFSGGTPETSDIANPSVSYDTPGEYPVSVVIGNGVNTSTIQWSQTISIYEQEPVADFEYMIGVANYTEFTSNSTNGYSYLWDFGDGTTSTEENPIHNYPIIDMEYTVTLTVTNGCGSHTITQTIQTTNNNDILKDEVSLNIYPNPNNGSFTIAANGLETQNVLISIYDIVGHRVYEQKINGISGQMSERLDLTGLATGTYIVKVDMKEGSAYSKLLIK